MCGPTSLLQTHPLYPYPFHPPYIPLISSPDMENIQSMWKDVTSFFTPADTLPWTDEKTIQACERDMLDPGQTAAARDNLMKLAWALSGATGPAICSKAGNLWKRRSSFALHPTNVPA
ncbi:unnamed protein product [Closterium sp. NIES-54]